MARTSKKNSEEAEKERKKHKKHKNKHKTHKEHKHKKSSKDKKEKRRDSCEKVKEKEVTESRKLAAPSGGNLNSQRPNSEKGKDDDNYEIPVELMNSKSHAPETPSEYEKRQKQLRREVDPVTGRTRLIRGTGEVLEEIVSKKRHNTINKEATYNDGQYFEENTLRKAK